MGKVPLYPYLIKHKHMSSPTRIFKFPKLIDDSSERDSTIPARDSTTPAIYPARFDYSDDFDRRTQLSLMIVSNMIQSRGEVLINHDLPIAENSNPLKRETQISPKIVSNMVQTQDEVLITNDLPIAGSRNFCQRGTQKSPLIMSNMIQTQDEIFSTHDSPIAGRSNVFERGTKTHPKTEWNSIQRVDEVFGIQHTRIRDSLISPSSGLVSTKRGLDSIGLVVYGSGK
ncbi:hypothetical protein YC2023_051499 [Brassica napus]